MGEAGARCCAVIVTYNRKGLLAECLDGLLGQTRPLEAIYIIDNASTDGTGNFLKERYLDRHINIRYIRMPENRGGAAGFHEGVRIAYNDGYDWLWIMDDDVSPAPDSLEVLLSNSDKSGVLIPIEVLKDSMKLIDTSAYAYDLVNPLRINPKRSVFEVFKSREEMPAVLEVKDFTFEGPLINRAVIAKSGFPRGDFFISGDDTEYALRIRNRGERLLLIKDSLIFKKKLSPRSSGIPWKDYYYKRNLFWIHKTYGKNIFVKYFKPIAYSLAAALLKGILRGNMVKVKVVYFAIIDAFTDNFIIRFRPE